MLHGKLVFLRAIEDTDLPLIHTWQNNSKILPYVYPGVPNPISLERLKKWHEEFQGDATNKILLICLQDSGEPIGTVEIKDINFRSRKGDLSIVIGDEQNWSQGYGTEALILFLGYCFRVLNLRRVSLEVYEYNERALKSYEKVGFQKEGYVRRSVFKDGQYHGEYILAILKDEYFARFPLK